MNKRITIGALAIIVSGALISGCGGNGGGDDGTGARPTPPSVTSVTPRSGDLSTPTAKRIVATFSVPMDPATFTSDTFRATGPGGPLAGTLSVVDRTATLSLNSVIPVRTSVTATITTAVRDRAGTPMHQNYSWTFKTGDAPDTVAPTVTSTDPVGAATGVATNKSLVVHFSETVAVASINASTFRLIGPGGAQSGNLTVLDNVVAFSPNRPLSASTTYTATLTTGIQDLSDNPLASDHVWTFTTGTNADTTFPRVTATDPTAGAVGVATNKNITATFSEEMDAATISSATFTLKKAGGGAIPATISYASRVAVLDPDASLTANTVYTAILSTGVKDTSGNVIEAAKVWNFTTAGIVDGTAPTVTSTNPSDGATNVFLNRSINATFSEPMRADTLNTSTFTVEGISGTVTYDTSNRIATFRPLRDLSPDTLYTANIGTGAKDSTGNSLAVRKVWTFRTGVQRAQGTIDLGAASTYAVLAGSTVTNAGPTVINGDLGLSPGSAVVGFPPGRVNGSIQAGNAVAAKAKSDLLTGQLEASSRLGAATLPGNLSGLTFTPGLYKNSTSVMLTAGNVTLDAQGDSDAVFIFQMGSTLTTSTGTQVVLAGGTKATNVYWSVGTSATLGVNSVFKGVILAEVSITVNTGARLDGTLLTKTGAVTLASNTVTRRPVRGD
ncbi:MAG: Ig-like domain-containing protein [Fimbriimonadaceae bacterium]|nr:Ig-like domain-containing protein [Fimbriimonadaceae bacterium]